MQELGENIVKKINKYIVRWLDTYGEQEQIQKNLQYWSRNQLEEKKKRSVNKKRLQELKEGLRKTDIKKWKEKPRI